MLGIEVAAQKKAQSAKTYDNDSSRKFMINTIQKRHVVGRLYLAVTRQVCMNIETQLCSP